MTDRKDQVSKALAALALGMVGCILILAAAEFTGSLILAGVALGLFCLLVAWKTVPQLRAYWPSMLALNLPLFFSFSSSWFNQEDNSGRVESAIILPFAVAGTIAGVLLGQLLSRRNASQQSRPPGGA